MKIKYFKFSNENIIKIIIAIYFSIITAKYMSGYPSVLFALPFLGAFLFVFIYSHLKKSKFFIIFLPWFMFFFLMALISAQNNNFRSIYYLLIGAGSFSVGYALYLLPKYSLRFSFWSLILFDIFILCSIVLGAEPSYVVLNELLPGVSRNAIGAMAIFFQIFYSTSYYRLNEKLPQLLIWVTLIIILLAFGRSSIVVGVLLFIVHIIFIAPKRNSFSIMLIAIITVSGSFINIQSYIEQDTNFTRGFESARLEILKEYLETTTISTFFLGHPISDSKTALSFNSNSHNSYIRMHSYYGIASILFLFSILLTLILKLNQQNWIYVIFISLYLIRAFFEPIALFDIFDFVLFYLLCLIYFPGRWGGRREYASKYHYPSV